MNKLKIAIIGAGMSGLSCALECERLGVPAEIYERQNTIGWMWPSISTWPDIFSRQYGNDSMKVIKEDYGINFKSALDERFFIMKSLHKETTIEGTLGISYYRGQHEDSIEQQLFHQLRKTPIHFNSLVDFRELAKEVDYIVISSGRDYEAKELGVWEEMGRISVMGAIALGSFLKDTTTIYFDTEYAGTGYARVSPFSDTEAIFGIYAIGKDNFELQQLDINRKFERFLEKEKLEKNDLVYRMIIPPYSTGKVSKFQLDNILLTGRAAGLTDRLLGTGGMESIMSGVLAARAMIKGGNYDQMIMPLKTHIENLSVFRTYLNNFTDDDFDRLISLIDTPGIKQMLYNTQIRFVDFAGSLLNYYKQYGLGNGESL